MIPRTHEPMHSILHRNHAPYDSVRHQAALSIARIQCIINAQTYCNPYHFIRQAIQDQISPITPPTDGSKSANASTQVLKLAKHAHIRFITSSLAFKGSKNGGNVGIRHFM